MKDEIFTKILAGCLCIMCASVAVTTVAGCIWIIAKLFSTL
jgi:hypothetical protein